MRSLGAGHLRTESVASRDLGRTTMHHVFHKSITWLKRLNHNMSVRLICFTRSRAPEGHLRLSLRSVPLASHQLNMKAQPVDMKLTDHTTTNISSTRTSIATGLARSGFKWNRRHKSLIAVAAMTFAGAAFAQSSVTIFGVVDARVAYGSGSVAKKTQLASSGMNASRLGFRGVEDLGDGMSASFWLESAVNVDDGSFGTTNTNNQSSGSAGGGAMVFGRRSTVSLSGNWGELRLGRDFTPQFWNLSEFDPFGTTGNGTTQTLNSIITGTTQVRASNSIGYFLPEKALNGFYGQGMYYLGENNSNAVNVVCTSPGVPAGCGVSTKNDGSGWGVRLGFKSGPFDVAAATSRTTNAAGSPRQSNIGGQWDAGVATIMAHYSWDKGVVNGSMRNAKGWLVGGLLPVGAGDIRISYSQYAVNLAPAPDRITKKWALGYAYNLSKRTALYVTYARLSNGGGATQALNGATTAANGSSTGYDMGIRHKF